MYMATNATCTNMTLECVKDPSAGSPPETLLRLLRHLGDEVHSTSKDIFCKAEQINLRIIQRITQSVGATGGAYKWQGRKSARADDSRLPGISRWRLTMAIICLHHDARCRLPNLFRQDYKLVECISVARVEPRTS